jgi:hypothetical protein
MEKDNSSVTADFIDIRFNHFYVVSIFIAAVILLVIIMTTKGEEWYYYFFLILPVLFFVHAIGALSGSKYVRLDKQTKTVIIYGPYGFVVRKYKFDRLFFKDKELYREVEGRDKLINIMRYQCRKNDLSAFIVEVSKGQ